MDGFVPADSGKFLDAAVVAGCHALMYSISGIRKPGQRGDEEALVTRPG